MLALAGSRAHAAATDYDGRWRLEGTCSAATTWPYNGPITFWTNFTVQNGGISEDKEYMASGLRAEDLWSGAVQEGSISLLDQGHNNGSGKWQRTINGRAVSATEITFTGAFYQWVVAQFVRSRTCSGTIRSVEPFPGSLAGGNGRPRPSTPEGPTIQMADAARQAVPQPAAQQQAAQQQVAAAQHLAQQFAPVNAPPGSRVALVVGNGAYVNADALRNPANDAHAVAAALRRIGFEVVEGTDLTRQTLQEKIQDFLHRASHAKLALVFYSGHGMQIENKNYLIPVDAKLEAATDLKFETVELDTILDALSDPGRTNIILLDACRDNPLARRFVSRMSATRSLGPSGGLAAYSAIGTGTLIAYATAPGQTALDGKGSDSPFTTSLLKYIGDPSLEIRQLLTRVRADVAATTANEQIPWDNSSLMGDVYLAK